MEKFNDLINHESSTSSGKDAIASSLRSFIENNFLVSFEEEGLDDDTNLFEAGIIDSFGLIELITFIERNFSKKFSGDELTSPLLSSISGMISLIKN